MKKIIIITIIPLIIVSLGTILTSYISKRIEISYNEKPTKYKTMNMTPFPKVSDIVSPSVNPKSVEELYDDFKKPLTENWNLESYIVGYESKWKVDKNGISNAANKSCLFLKEEKFHNSKKYIVETEFTFLKQTDSILNLSSSVSICLDTVPMSNYFQYFEVTKEDILFRGQPKSNVKCSIQENKPYKFKISVDDTIASVFINNVEMAKIEIYNDSETIGLLSYGKVSFKYFRYKLLE